MYFIYIYSSFCPLNSSIPTPCPAGTYGSAAGLLISDCSGLCPVGYLFNCSYCTITVFIIYAKFCLASQFILSDWFYFCHSVSGGSLWIHLRSPNYGMLGTVQCGYLLMLGCGLGTYLFLWSVLDSSVSVCNERERIITLVHNITTVLIWFSGYVGVADQFHLVC